MVSLLVRPMLFSTLFLNTDGTKTTQEVFFPANSVPQLNTRPSAFSTAQEPSADLTPRSAEHWVHFT